MFFYCVVPENIHTHPKEGHWKLQGGGGLKSQFESVKLNWNLKMWGFKPINLPWWGYGSFLEQHI